MSDRKHRSPLLVEEDWWTVWFGLLILLAATIFGILALDGQASALQVPKLGKWVSSPSDAFFSSENSKIVLEQGATLALLVEQINGRQSNAIATIEPHEDGYRLRLTSSRSGERETISLSTLLAGGEATLVFTPEQADASGLGARSYFSNVLRSPDVVVARDGSA